MIYYHYQFFTLLPPNDISFVYYRVRYNDLCPSVHSVFFLLRLSIIVDCRLEIMIYFINLLPVDVMYEHVA